MKKFLAIVALFGMLGGWMVVGAFLADPPPARAQTPSPVQIGHAGEASFLPGFDGNRPIFILAIGSDARPGVCEPVERCLADSIQLIGINPRKGAASVLGFPRDSYVPIPGVGSRKINDSLFYGGPELVAQTVEDLVGVNIDYYLLTSFFGLSHMVNSVGGVEVEIPYSIGASGDLPAFAPGVHELDGKQALALARNRKGVPNGDFSRSENQGRLIVAALEQFRKEVRREPLTLLRWLVAGMTHIQMDLSAGEVFQLALSALTIEPNRVTNRVTPGGISTVGGASVVTLGSEAEAMFADIRDDGLLEPAG